MAGKIAYETFNDSWSQSAVSIEFQYVEQVTGMLPVHGRYQLAAIEFVEMKHRDLEIREENVLRLQCQGARLHR